MDCNYHSLTVTDIIQTAISKINDVGCVSLVPAKDQAQDYVAIKLGQNYSSHVGRQGGEQELTVVKDEIDTGSIMHELMHALGMSAWVGFHGEKSCV